MYPIETVNAVEAFKAMQTYYYHANKKNLLRICRAYEILSDDEEGPKYDETGIYDKWPSDYSKGTLYELAMYGASFGILLKVKEFKDESYKEEINAPDMKRQNSPLYIASRNGHFDTVEALLACSADPANVQLTLSTPLHAACFFGHIEVAKKLLEAGASIYAKNIWELSPIDEAYDEEVKKLLISYGEIPFYQVLLKVREKVDRVELRKGTFDTSFSNKIVAKKYSLKNSATPKGWKRCWHGTKIKCLESILKLGLRMPGDSDSNGNAIQICEGHIKRIEWAKGIFVSESILYSGSGVYSERITLEKEKWVFLLECQYDETNKTEYVIGNNTTPAYEMKEDDKFSEMERKINDPKIIKVVAFWLVLEEFLNSFETTEESDLYVTCNHIEKILNSV